MSRPYLSLSINDLRGLFIYNPQNVGMLRAIANELTHRTTRAAKDLLADVQRKLSDIEPEESSGPNQPTPSATPFKLTAEQDQAVQLFLTQKSLKINAFAGTGKTSTLAAIAHSDNRHGIYLAFNKTIATDASKRFPRHIDCRTVHSLAFRTMLSRMRDATKLTTTLNGNAAAAILGLSALPLTNSELQPTLLGTLIVRTIQRYCQTADTEILPKHIPVTGRLAGLQKAELEAVSTQIVSKSRELWNRMKDPNTIVPLGHDGYLKLWAISGAYLPYDYVLLDEAQDTNEVVLDILNRQASQLVIVGDRHQQIYAWRGAVNAMRKINTANESFLTMSFRFGDTIAAAANRILRVLGETHQLRGNPKRHSQIGTTEFDVCLCRTNAALMKELVGAIQSGVSVHVVGGTDELKRLLQGVVQLQNGHTTDVPELFGFRDWNDVLIATRDSENHELATLVNLVQQFRVDQLMTTINKVCPEASRSEFCLSTVHKAKGCEWDRVLLADDFLTNLTQRPQHEGGKIVVNAEELRILYVAVTRARIAVHIPPHICQMFRIFQDPKYNAESIGRP